VHRDIEQNRKKANVGRVELGALAEQATPQTYWSDLARGSIRRMSAYGTIALGRKADIQRSQ